jgi:aerobic-type carbon monoxide dehydrogenase small subunit (CoxS/CutS family)
MQLEFVLNGKPASVDTPADVSLLTVLRDYLGMTGTKEGCGIGECGACSVLLDGSLVNSCLMLAAQASGRQVVTIEGVRGPDGGANDLQQAFIDHGAVQCGFCIPGMVLAGEALLAANPNPTRAEIREAIAGNLCRCTGYKQIVDAIEATARQRQGNPLAKVGWVADRSEAPLRGRPPTTDRQYIGRPAARVDAPEKVLGTAKYVGDYRLPGMLLARALRSTLPHARIVRVDVTPALEVPGVLAAITCDDFVNHGRFGFPVQDMYMLAHQRVRYVGDAIAAVAAETETALQAGLNAIRLELEPLPGVFDPVEALRADSPIVGEQPWEAPDLPRGNLLTQYIVRKGEPDAIMAECAVTLDEAYSTMHQEHAYIETEGALAVPWPDGGGVTIYAACQSPFVNRNNLCQKRMCA